MYSGSISAEDSDPLQQPERMMKLQSKTKRPNNSKTVDNTLQVHHANITQAFDPLLRLKYLLARL